MGVFISDLAQPGRTGVSLAAGGTVRSAVDIAAWLESLGLKEYEHAFRKNAIDADVLPKLTAEDLKDLGITAALLRISSAIVHVVLGGESFVALAEGLQMWWCMWWCTKRF